MPVLFRRILICLLIAFSLHACTLNRTGLGPGVAAEWQVEPALFCPGDTVTISWDMTRMPRSHDNCRPRNGGFSTLTRCTSSSVCTAGGEDAVCLDDHCCRRDIYERNSLECPVSTGCYPDFGVTVTANGEDLSPPLRDENRRVTGSRMLTPTETTEFAFTGFYNPPTVLFEDTKTATMVTPEPPTNITADFAFACFGNMPGWRSVDFNSASRASAHVRVAGVRNTTGHHIILASREPERGAVTLAPGAFTTELNGPLSGIWSARLAAFDPAGLVRPRCEATNAQDPWPDLEVEILLQCVAE